MHRRCLPTLAAALLLAACSSTKLVYDNLDWVVSWQVGKFVSLNEPQRELLESGFKTLWQWHRNTQLALYVRDIRAMADAMPQPVTREQVADFMQRTAEHGKRAFHESLPEIAKLLASMDDQQVHDLLKHMREQREKQVNEETHLSVEEQQDRAVESAEKRLDPWIGDLTADEERRLHDWAQARRYENAMWETYQENWSAAFAGLLGHRQEPGFEGKLTQLFEDPDVPLAGEIKDVQAHNRIVWISMMTDLSQLLTADQRKRAQAKLRSLAKDLEELAAEPVKS